MTSHLPPIVLAPEAPIDLQLHTTASDGQWTAEQLLDHVAGEGFALVTVTDHDRVDTIWGIQRLGLRRGVPVLAATELSATWDGAYLDLLCFGFDPGDSPLVALAEQTRHGQLESARATYAALLRAGYRFPEAGAVLADVDGTPRHLGDLLALLERHGYAAEAGTALRAAGFRYVTADPVAVVDAAHRSGAVCVIAQPDRGDGFVRLDAPQLDRLRATVPVDGLEV